MARRTVIIKKGSGEGSAADKAFDKRHPGMKEGSKMEEAFDKRMKKPRKKSRGK
jgi:hypothetical protein